MSQTPRHLLQPGSSRSHREERNDVGNRRDVDRDDVEVVHRERRHAGERLEPLQEQPEEALHLFAVVLLERRGVALSDALERRGGVFGGEVTDDLLERLGCLGHGERERELDRGGWRRRRWFRRLCLLRLRLGTAVRLRVRRPRLRVGIVRELRVGIVRELLLFTSLRWGPILFTLGFFLFVIILVIVLVIVVIVALTAHGAFQELLGVHPALLQLLAHSLHLEVLILIPGIRIVTFVVVVGVVGFILLIITILVVVVGILHVAAILQDAQLPQALLARVELGGHLVSLLLKRLRHLLLIVQRHLTVVGLGLLGRLLLPVFIPGRVFIGPGEVKVTVEVVAPVAAILVRFFLFFFALVAVQPALLGGAFSLPLRLGAARGVSPAGRTHVIVGDAVVVRVHRVHSLQTSPLRRFQSSRLRRVNLLVRPHPVRRLTPGLEHELPGEPVVVILDGTASCVRGHRGERECLFRRSRHLLFQDG